MGADGTQLSSFSLIAHDNVPDAAVTIIAS
jgi:hypothetical protein